MTYDISIIGGGIVGLATAMTLSKERRCSVLVLEAESKLASHQTGHNSGVIHSGLYYKPGSQKAINCAQGRDAMYRFCAEHDLPHDRCGKIVVATRNEELPALEELERRGQANGLEGLKRLAAEELTDYEPHVAGIAGLLVPQTGIVDFVAVANQYAKLATEAGAEIRKDSALQAIRRDASELVLATTSGEFRARHLINCGGLQCDRVARMCGIEPGIRIVPFRGEYYELVPERESLVKNLIYPVPDPQYPFLGVHFTRMIHGGIEAGPNAVLAWRREGYRKGSFKLRDAFSSLGYGGFWRLIARHMKMGIGETYRSYVKSAMVAQLQRLIPELRKEDVFRAGAGVRAQAVWPDGKLLDDFHIIETDRMVHVLNAPSPAATSSLSIGQSITERAMKSFDLK